MLSDSYKQINKINPLLFKLAGGVLLVLVSFILFFTYGNSNKSPEELETMISSSERLNRVNKLCQDLSKPYDFQLVGKHFSGNSITSALSFDYSSKLNYKEVREFFIEVLTRDGWAVDEYKNIDFKKGKQKISVYPFTFPKADYSIYCGEEY